MEEKIISIILNVLKNSADNYEIEELKSANKDTKLYSELGGLLGLITDLEENLTTELDIEITLADEKMMSLRNSPFKDVQTLSQYIAGQIKRHKMQKVILITGTRKGIGKQLIEYYLSLGHIVCVCSRGASSINHKIIDIFNLM